MSAPVAIVGIACRFPGAAGPQELWRALEEGRDAITEVPRNRFDIDALYDPTPRTPGKIASRWGGFIEGIERFDAAFFGITPREARAMDPQQRLLLETAWEAFEDAGVVPGTPATSSTGVFVGMHASDYQELQSRSVLDQDLFTATGGSRNAAAGRISFGLGLTGPSLVIDSDRSSSLVAVHLACQSLRSGECDLALAGGVNLVLSPTLSIAFSRNGMLAVDGRCKFCDAAANGFVRSDGAGMVLLKPLARAIADGDPIYAVIEGSATNHEGTNAPGFMTPSVVGQRALLLAACRNANVDPARIDYVEAHGTGTRVGDRTEIEALGEAYGKAEGRLHPLAVGSVKTNIGHPESAAGIAGLIKVALALQHRAIPRSLHVSTPSPEIAFDELNVAVQLQHAPWPTRAWRATAGVSSFGLTGTNAHVILSAAPDRERPENAEEDDATIVLSARSEASLAAAARQLQSVASTTSSLRDLAYTASRRRAHHRHRMAASARSLPELAAELDRFAKEEPTNAVAVGVASERPKIVFVFPGQGGQWFGMARELLAKESVFRAHLERCDDFIRGEAGWSLLAELTADKASSRLTEIDVLQPALVAIETALAALWRSWGVEPDVVTGTSMGEIAATHAAGILSLEDALRVVCRRTRLMKRLRGKGAMAVVAMTAEESAELIRGHENEIAIAAINSRTSTVLAGDPRVLEDIVARVRARNVFTEWVKVDIASHSPQMEVLRSELLENLRELRPQAGTIPFYSCVTAGKLDGATADAQYWARNLRESVRLAPVVETLLEGGFDVFLEMSPHPLLRAPINDAIEALGRDAVALPSTRRNEPERREMLRSLGVLYTRGYPVDWSRHYPAGRVVTLPRYAWDRKAYWFEADGGDAARDRAAMSIAPAVEPSPETPSPASLGAGLARRLAEVPATRRRDVLLDFLLAQLSRILEVEVAEVDPAVPFRDLGLNSVMMEELAAVIGRALGKRLPSTTLFNRPNVSALSDFLLASFFDAPAPTPGGRVLGHILVDQGVVTEEQLTFALAEQDREKHMERLGSLMLRLGLVERDQLHAALMAQLSEPIAIVGIGCRLPGNIADAGDLLAALRRGDDCITDVPPSRWSLDELYDPDPLAPGKIPTRRAGFVADVDRFDAAFFGIPPAEAARMDPQHRLLLETVWSALEDAGQSTDELAGSKTGVFIGISNVNDYAATKLLTEDRTAITAYDAVADAMSIAAGRISYLLGLNGPALAVDTACSSSLVALHLACQSLRVGDSDAALVGGVNLMLAPNASIAYSKAGMLAHDGRCKTFDAAANGYVRGEGCVVFVLRKLSAAIARRDRVLALVPGSAINQDGRSAGLTAPSGTAQEKLLRAALANAQVTAAALGYVEAHGTGTRLGDPIEMNALASVLGEGRADGNTLYVGSLKTNVGHLEAAAGAVGLAKAVLSLQHEAVFPNLHFERLNPAIDLRDAPIEVPTKVIAWPRGSKPRYAGVSSFGYSGTNAHVIVQEAPPPAAVATTENAREHQLFVLSARTSERLAALAERHETFLGGDDGVSLADMAFTAAAGRTHHPHRLAIVGSSRAEIAEKLRAWRAAPESDLRGVASGVLEKSRAPKVAFLFTGQGAQYSGMARRLYETEPRFKQTLDRCAEITHGLLPTPLLEVLFDESAAASLDDSRYTQPALFTVEVAVAQLLRHWGVAPAMLLGHSLGEIAAASVAGALSLEDGLRLVVERGRLMSELPRNGKMLAVQATREEALEWIARAGGPVALAAVNGPTAVVVSGAAEAVDAIGALAVAAGKKTRPLRVSHAFHSPLVEPMLAPLESFVAGLRVEAPEIPVVSNLTGTLLGDEMRAPSYWSRHAREAVLFDAGMRRLVEFGCDVFVEVGPGGVLTSMARAAHDAPARSWSPSLIRGEHDGARLLQVLGELHVRGVPFRAEAVFDGAMRRRVKLPTYPFRRDRHWLDGSGAPHAPVAREQETRRTVIDRIREAAEGERPAMLRSWLASEVAEVIGLDAGAGLDLSASYYELGMSSLMALDLQRRLRNKLGVELPPFPKGIDGESVDSLARIVLRGAAAGERAPSSAAAIVPFRVVRPNAKVRLFCFPFAGGTASTYRAWPELLDERIEVCPVELPGRGGRAGEAPISDMAALRDRMLADLAPLLDRPVALFGHSMGAKLAFEIASQLGDRVVHLFASAAPAPNVEPPRIAHLDDEAFLEALRALGGTPEALLTETSVMDAHLTRLRADTAANESPSVPPRRLSCGITVLAGTADRLVPMDAARAWETFAGGRFRLVSVEAGHFFLSDAAQRVANEIVLDLEHASRGRW